MPVLLRGQLSVALVVTLLALVLLLQPELLGEDHPYFKQLVGEVRYPSPFTQIMHCENQDSLRLSKFFCHILTVTFVPHSMERFFSFLIFRAFALPLSRGRRPGFCQ